MDIESNTLSSISRLLNPSLIFHLWIYQLIFMLTISSMYLLFEVYLTDWVPFEFQQASVFSSTNSGVTLPEVLSMDNIPIMQHLGYLDFYNVAQRDEARRSVLFTLSQPGGHPYTWNCIIEKCLSLLKKFNTDLNAISTKTKDQEFVTSQMPILQNTQTYQKEYTYHMRSLVMDKEQTTIAAGTDLKQNPYNEMISKFIKSKWQNFVAYLFSKPLINYIFGEQEDNKLRHALFNYQVVIWASEAISTLSVVSLTEDLFGIAQKDLPVIIDTLLMLKQTLDKLYKSYIVARKQQSDDKQLRQTFASLRSATKRSIYKMTTNFENYIMDLALEPASVEQLQTFLNYKE